MVFTYTRDTRVPTAVGAPLEVFAEPLAYGDALRFETEIASAYLGSNRPDFQQVRLQANTYLRLLNQTWLQLRLFGGWSAGTIPLQRKLTLAGIDTVRSYPYRLRFLGDRLLGGTVGLRLPVLRDIRVELPGRYMSLRALHLSPFVDGGWVWERDQTLSDVTLRSGAGLRIITGFAFVSMLHFEVVVDIAHPLDAQGRDEGEGVQFWIRFQTTAKSVLN
jgi:hemolysin activation/secretion protein